MQILQPDRPPSEMPGPRFAHQVVYSPNTKSVFLHGGNAGEGDGPIGDGSRSVQEEKAGSTYKERRLDDFWRMELKRFVRFMLGHLFVAYNVR